MLKRLLKTSFASREGDKLKHVPHQVNSLRVQWGMLQLAMRDGEG
jgi:hypothetical protein